MVITETLKNEFVTLANTEGRSTASLVFFVWRWFTFTDEATAKAGVRALLEETGLEDSLLSPSNISKLRKVATVFAGEGGADNATALRDAIKGAPSQGWRRLYAAITYLERNGSTATFDAALATVLDRSLSTRVLRGETDGEQDGDGGQGDEGIKDLGLSAIMTALHAARARVSDGAIIAALEALE